MLLTFADGKPFATGVIPYAYTPAGDDRTPRILLQVEFENILSTAAIDTGAPYVICAPAVAQLIGLDPMAALEQITIQIRGVRIRGNLHRLTLSFPASEGEPLSVDSTVFVPDEQSSVDWGNLPSFIGLTGCLERIRFAVDPSQDIFFFGSL